MTAQPVQVIDDSPPRSATPTDDGIIRNVCLDDADLFEELLPQLRDVVRRGAFTLGPELEEFERQAASTFGCAWAVGTSSGTSALMLALRASPLEPRSRVALPANTFFATAEAVVLAGHLPVVVDHEDDHLIDLDILRSLDCDAVVPVHLHGLPVDMNTLNVLAAAKGWWVLEDAAQAHGALVGGRPIGSFGHAAAFSAYPTKNLGAWGDAGLVTGSDLEFERRIRALRHHGQTLPNHHVLLGGTDRLDNLQAVVLRAKLDRLAGEVLARRKVAAWYSEEIADTGLRLPGDRGDRRHAYHHYVVSLLGASRDDFVRALRDRGIEVAVHYPTPVHRQPAMAGRFEQAGSLRRAESSANEVVSLPMHSSLSRSDVARVGAAVRDYLLANSSCTKETLAP